MAIMASLSSLSRVKWTGSEDERRIMTQDSSTYWRKSRVELRAAGFDPDRSPITVICLPDRSNEVLS